MRRRLSGNCIQYPNWCFQHLNWSWNFSSHLSSLEKNAWICSTIEGDELTLMVSDRIYLKPLKKRWNFVQKLEIFWGVLYMFWETEPDSSSPKKYHGVSSKLQPVCTSEHVSRNFDGYGYHPLGWSRKHK